MPKLEDYDIARFDAAENGRPQIPVDRTSRSTLHGVVIDGHARVLVGKY